MKKFIQAALIVAVFLSGCSGLTPLLDLVATHTPSLPPETFTPPPTVTLIPTRDLFAMATPTRTTYTPARTPLAPDDPTETPTMFFPLDPLTLTPVKLGFLMILLSSYTLYYNTGPCSPRIVTFNIALQDARTTDYLLLFMRPREKSDTMLLGEWSSLQLDKNEDNTFSYDVSAVNVRKYYWFRDAWIEYQLIAYDKKGNELFRSDIFNQSLSLVMCRSLVP